MTTGISVLVIGGGVAGSACAIRLRQLGLRVDLVEKQTFPRNKACGCCLGEAGLDVLEKLGLRKHVTDAGVATKKWIASFDSQLVRLDIPHGVAVSRQVLDPMLLGAAIDLGTDVTMNCSATISNADNERVEAEWNCRDSRRRQSYDVVVVASGLTSGAANKSLPWRKSPHGPFGVSFLAECRLVEPETIYMACGDDGYVGVVRLADGRVDVAAALRSGKQWASLGSPRERIERLLSESCFRDFRFDNVEQQCTTSALRRTRRFGNSRVIAIGDAASYVEPFTGEGMTWAMESGVAAAEMISRTGELCALGLRWEKELTELLKSKKRLCAAVTTAIRSPMVRRCSSKLLTTFPSAAQPFLNWLSAPANGRN